MSTRKNITKVFAKEYAKASKLEKGKILDNLCATTGWSRSNARLRLREANKEKGRLKKKKQSRNSQYKDIKGIVIKVWKLSGFMNEKYLVSELPNLLEFYIKNKNIQINEIQKDKLLSISASAVYLILKPVKNKIFLQKRYKSRRSNFLQESIPEQRFDPEKKYRLGELEIDTVFHSGESLIGKFARTLTATDCLTGWTENICLLNDAKKWITEGLYKIKCNLPFEMIAIDSDNGTEFINEWVISWVNENKLQFTRSRPYKKNDNAHVEQKNGAIVRKYAFYYRYDTQKEVDIINELYSLTRLWCNYFAPTRKVIGSKKSGIKRATRIYDNPKTPYQRVLECDEVSKEDKVKLQRIYEKLNPAKLISDIVKIQCKIMKGKQRNT